MWAPMNLLIGSDDLVISVSVWVFYVLIFLFSVQLFILRAHVSAQCLTYHQGLFLHEVNHFDRIVDGHWDYGGFVNMKIQKEFW